MALITLSRATELVPNFNSADDAVMQDCVDAASDLIEKWCNRTFAVTLYDELYDGTGHQNLLLNNYPITYVDRVMYNWTQVISIGNPSQAVSRANFRTDTSPALYLSSMSNGTLTQHTINLTTCPTFGDVANAINAFSADGWTAKALGIYATYSTSDLYAPQGGQEVRWSGYGYLWHHTVGVPTILSNPTIGEIVSNWTPFTRGYQMFRVVYQAGFAVIPNPVQQACAELACACYNGREVNANLASENLGNYSYANIAEKSFNNLSIASRYSLYQFKNSRIVKFKVY